MLPGGRGAAARWLAAALAVAVIAGCSTTSQPVSNPAPVAEPVAEQARFKQAKFEQDRQAILAMAGNYQVTFDFREITPIAAGYQLRKPKTSGGDEIIRLVEDRGTFISLQHLLVVGEGESKAVVKHWRQDWTYEPASVLVFIGGNAWERRAVLAKDRAGKWSQVVYQVEDSPRYGALGAWSHANGVSQWTPPAEIKPLPRRDMTTRDDYDAILAVNRHVITPYGWVQEEDNSKLSLAGKPQVLVREIGVNTYRRSDRFDVKFGDDYWNATKDFWALVRADWKDIEQKDPKFGLTVQGEPAALYDPILELADDVQAGKKTAAAAAAEAKLVIAKLTTADVGTLAERLAKKKPPRQASATASVIP